VSVEKSNQSITILHNYWRVPSPERAFDGWLEGKPSEEDKRRVIEEAIAERKAWTPSPEAMRLVEQLKAFAGCRVRLQFWNPIMYWLEEEGAYPVDVDCIGVTLLQDGDHLQAYIQVSNAKEFPNQDGHSAMSYFQQRADCEYLLAPLADLYSVTKV